MRTHCSALGALSSSPGPSFIESGSIRCPGSHAWCAPWVFITLSVHFVSSATAATVLSEQDVLTLTTVQPLVTLQVASTLTVFAEASALAVASSLHANANAGHRPTTSALTARTRIAADMDQV